MEELLKLWIEACDAYYGNGQAIMSDIEFDNLTEKLRSFNDPEINKVINGIEDANGGVKPVSSETVMLSLKKIKMNESDASKKFNDFIGDKLKECKYAPKYDGMSIKVVIENNVVVKCLTRGGMDVTNKLKDHHDIKNLSEKFPGKNTIHGELLIKKEIFKKHFSDGMEYSSIRNCVPGILKTREPIEIDYFLDYVPCTDGVNTLGDVWKPADGVDFFKEFEKFNSDEFPYQVDGVVVGFYEKVQRVKDNYPLNIVALKFKTVSKITTITGVTWSQKKTGKLVPVYDIEPVSLNGVTCTHANGYNYEMMKINKCGIGAKVKIIKTGEIIPVVDEVVVPSENYEMPLTDYEIDGINLVAKDKNISKMYKFYLGLKVFQINGIGNRISDIIGSCCNYDIIELFNPVHKQSIGESLGFGAAFQKFSEFYSIKSITLDTLIEIMQFDNCGKIVSRRIAELLVGQTNDTKGLNQETYIYMTRGEGVKLIKEASKRLVSFGIKVLNPSIINESTITFEMSNPPKSGITKEQFVKELQKKYPNAVHTTLTKNTKYLFCDDVNANTGKILKARKYNLKIMTYEDALKNNNL